jgi:hypothetical protein
MTNVSSSSISFTRTSHEIGRAVALHQRRRGAGSRLPAMISAIDQLLAEVEDLNLRDVRQVPKGLRDRVAEVVAGSLGELPAEMPARWRTGYAMDLLYDAQDQLTRMRSAELGLAREDLAELERD